MATAPTTTAAPPAEWVTLFNREAFHALNLRAGQRALSLAVADPEGRTIGALGGVLDGASFTGGHSAPFGGFDVARDKETPVNVALLVDGALARVRAAGARRVTLRMPPAALGASEGTLQFTLLNRGFTVVRCELNQHIDLTGLADVDAYLAALKSPARRALRKLLAAGELTARTAESAADWDAGHGLLAANRAAKGRRFALTRDYAEAARHALPGALRLLLLEDAAGRAVAAALVYRVRPGRDAVVAWGDAPGHGLERSPMNLLAFRVVEAAFADGVAILDLGISSEPDADATGALPVNGGLHQFKQSVLAQTTPRLHLAKEL